MGVNAGRCLSGLYRVNIEQDAVEAPVANGFCYRSKQSGYREQTFVGEFDPTAKLQYPGDST